MQRGDLELPSELYLTTQVESKRGYRVAMCSLAEPANQLCQSPLADGATEAHSYLVATFILPGAASCGTPSLTSADNRHSVAVEMRPRAIAASLLPVLGTAEPEPTIH